MFVMPEWSKISDFGIEVLRHEGTLESAVVVEHNGSKWLLAEEGEYEPVEDPHAAEVYVPGCTQPGYDGEYPFKTEGTRWYINLDEALGYVYAFASHEGQIQSINYALESLAHGGECEDSRYIDYIHDLIDGLVQHITDYPGERNELSAEQIAELKARYGV